MPGYTWSAHLIPGTICNAIHEIVLDARVAFCA